MAFRLFLAGTNRIGMVPLESIAVTEVGPGGVSSMKFVIEDPTEIITLARLDSVGFDPGAVADRIFYGYVTTVTLRPLAVGRTIEVEATGAEALLDWLIGAPLLITAATNFGTAIGNIISGKTASLGIGAPETTQHGNATDPIGSLDRADGHNAPFMTGGVNWTVPSGTLRWQIEELHRKTARDETGTKVAFGFLFTIDFNLRVRVWEDSTASTSWMPDDYGSLDVNTTIGSGDYVPESLEHSLDYGAVPNRVRVVWASGAGFVGTNTFPGIEHVLNDPNILTGAERDIAGANYLLQNDTPQRGTFRLTDWTPPVDVHAGSLISGTFNSVDFTGFVVRIMQIEKTFHGTGRQDWTVTYGRMGDNFTRSVAQAFGR